MFEAPPPPWNPPPVVHQSPVTPQAGPLDLASASLGQDGTELQLTITTRGALDPRALDHRGPRALCLTLRHGTTKTALCVAATSAGTPILRRVSLEPPGKATRIASTETLDGTDASPPRSRPSTPACRSAASSGRSSRPGTARTDPIGEVDARARLLAVPDCFGAAARDPAHPCSNPALAKVVTPTPTRGAADAQRPLRALQAAAASSTRATSASRPNRARATFALLGDSHAEHWRAALEVVAQSKRWRGISLSRSGCPYNTAGREAAHATGQRPRATAGRARSGSFLADQKQVHTVFVAARASADFTRDPRRGRPRGAALAAEEHPPDLRDARDARDLRPGVPLRQPPPARRSARSARPAPCPAPPSCSPTPRHGRRAAASRSSTSRSTCVARPSAHRSSAACSSARTART